MPDWLLQSVDGVYIESKLRFRRCEMALIKALTVNMAISAIWYGLEWMQYKELQWDRECDNIVWTLYLLVLWWLFAHQN